MHIFNRKEKISLSTFCSDYYSKYFISPSIEDFGLANVYDQLMIEKISEVDQSFVNINAEAFASEVLKIKFETFAIAWLHQFGNDLSIEQSLFTEDYLKKKGLQYIWDETQPYNLAVSRSANFGDDPNTDRGKIRILDLNRTRVTLFNKYVNEGHEGTCVARVLNRLGTQETWGRTITPNFLTMQAMDQLGCELNEEARFRMTSFIFGFYEGAKTSWAKLKIV